MNLLKVFSKPWVAPDALKDAMENNREAKSKARHAAKTAVNELSAIDLYGESLELRKGNHGKLAH